MVHILYSIHRVYYASLIITTHVLHVMTLQDFVTKLRSELSLESFCDHDTSQNIVNNKGNSMPAILTANRFRYLISSNGWSRFALQLVHEKHANDFSFGVQGITFLFQDQHCIHMFDKWKSCSIKVYWEFSWLHEDKFDLFSLSAACTCIGTSKRDYFKTRTQK